MKPTMNNITITETNEAFVNFAQTIDFTELFEHIVNFTRTSCTFDEPEITTNKHGEVYIRFQSENIVSVTGPFAAILKECYFHSFSNGVCRDRDTNEIKYWVSVSIGYAHKDGGSNGMEVCHAWYTDNEGWIFADVGDR